MKRLVPIGLIIAALGVQASLAERADAQDAARPGPSAVATADAAPVSSYVTGLRTDLEEIIRRPGWTGDVWSVMVVSLDRGDTLFSHGGADPLTPASNMKLFTTAAALYYLGPDFRFNTFLMATGPIRDGVLEGDIVVYGTGDPTFSNRFGNSLSVFQAFADTLSALGVREIRGDVVGDGSYFQGPGTAEGWQTSYMNASYAASSGALSYAENVATLQIRPGKQAGWRPEITLVPGGEGIAIVNQATTVAGRGGRVDASRIAYDGPIVVRGRIGTGAQPVLRSVPVSDPARLAAAVFREVLQRREITVTGGVRSVQTEAESPVTGRSTFAPALDSQQPVHVLAVHTSEPLLRVLDIINKKSHNLMAEQVLRTVGRVAVGEGTVAAGQRAVRHMIEQEGGRADLAMYDGSGLSILNRASARDFIVLLSVMSESPMYQTYLETLPQAGAAGGLRRMHRTNAEGNLRAKTGTINHVSALSGYVTAANGERLAFSIISNNVPSTWMAKRVEDAIGARIAEFERPAGNAVAGAQDAPASPEAAANASESGATAAEATATAPAPAARTPAPAASTAKTHTIRSGDTLDGIAKRYGVSVAALQRANPGLNPRRLQPGRSVKLP
ncbi:MAG TPA: D-alanyl-D-alanine carboxypeptidase/D-alanyl-D-alanine-endopeptidase [Longimicrobiales bacterium]|nr:D-alanyl-D-alanine carboxypeptidase/D-alanyl-D-alanine-endopeptidase [Longimicrobiales bacterium]